MYEGGHLLGSERVGKVGFGVAIFLQLVLFLRV